jgi:hypothetical protein
VYNLAPGFPKVLEDFQVWKVALVLSIFLFFMKTNLKVKGEAGCGIREYDNHCC